VRSFWLGKKKGKEAFVVPRVVDGRVEYEIGHDPRNAPRDEHDGTVARTAATCLSCGRSVPLTYVRAEGRDSRLGARLIAVVAEGNRQRTYLAPTVAHELAAEVDRPDSLPVGSLPPHGLSPANPQTVRIYGIDEWSDMFTDRQSTALTTFSDLVSAARAQVLNDALSAGFELGDRLESGGTDASAYADAVATYLGLATSRCTDYFSTINTWASTGEFIRNVFSRQAIPMTWDFAETNPFSDSTGNFQGQVEWTAGALDRVSATPAAEVLQADAASRSYAGALISTDPPYYDNIGYSDLSDYFYVWLRRSMREIHPSLLSTILVPKAEELVANPHRHGGKDGAKKFFETGFEQVFGHARRSAMDDFPIAVYYAFKQSEADEGGQASTGWETILGSMVRAGWRVTATWPVRSEMGNRMISSGSNALASSVVLALRPRPEDAAVTDRRGFIAAMKRELGPALRELQQGGIAPVDLPQSAIGPGMAVFSRYAKVIESDGSEMSVRSALARINEVLDELLTEQEGDFDPTTRFAIAWYRGNGYEAGAFGDAENLARARATAVSAMERGGILSARAGKVQLYRPANLPDAYDVTTDQHTSAWEALQHTIRVQETKGIPAAGAFLHDASRRSDGAVDLDLVKELAYLLFQVAEKNGWTKDAISFNSIATSWSELLESGRTAAPVSSAPMLDFDALDA
jgi:putative DNA methylase